MVWWVARLGVVAVGLGSVLFFFGAPSPKKKKSTDPSPSVPLLVLGVAWLGVVGGLAWCWGWLGSVLGVATHIYIYISKQF